MFQFREERVLKKSKKGEFEFYEGIQDRESQEKALLLSMIPKYFGIEGDRLVLENLMQSLEVPCAIDIKIGFSTWFDDYPPQKLSYMKNKDRVSTTNSIGLRYAGMTIRDKDNRKT